MEIETLHKDRLHSMPSIDDGMPAMTGWDATATAKEIPGDVPVRLDAYIEGCNPRVYDQMQFLIMPPH